MDLSYRPGSCRYPYTSKHTWNFPEFAFSPLYCPPFIKTSQLAIYHADLTFIPSVLHYHECTHFSVGFPVGGSASNPGRFSALLLTKADALLHSAGLSDTCRRNMRKDSSCALNYSTTAGCFQVALEWLSIYAVFWGNYSWPFYRRALDSTG
uniref:Uncharacterized protein n=1 Tax=Poecilia mexicana TaxID=48701 RepID=A0A3B3Y590_9TELE